MEKMPNWLDKQAYLSPNTIALEMYDGRTYTFQELKEHSEKMARKLTSLQVKEGDHIAILSNNREELAFIAYASIYIGAVLVFINTKLTKREIEYQLEEAKVSLLIAERNQLETKAIDFTTVQLLEEMNKVKESTLAYKQFIALDKPYTMMFTSGTTGFPKAVVHTYRNHWASAVSSALNLGLQKQDKWLLTLPIFHIGGFSTLMKSIIYGMTVYLVDKYDRSVVYDIIQHKNITIASFVTVMLKQYVEDIQNHPLPKSLRCILLGGGSVPPTLLEQVKKRNIPLFQSYGMTETTSQIVTLSEQDASRKLGSAGKPLFTAEIAIHAPDKKGVGEIKVRGPMVMQQYFNNKEANDASFQDGWFYTGDLGYIDDEGFLYVVERRSDLIISGGENIYPTEVEQVLLGYSGICDVAVVGKRDEQWGEVPVAFIVATKPIKEVHLQEYVKDKLAKYKIPKEWYTVDDLPRTASNKLMRYKLEERLK